MQKEIKQSSLAVKTAIKKVDAAIAANDKTLLQQKHLKAAITEIDKAASKGVFHKKNCI